jgi:hypothetical protein
VITSHRRAFDNLAYPGKILNELEQRKGIRDRPRRGPTEIPGHPNVSEGRGQFALGVIGKDQNWSTELEHKVLRGVLLDCDRLPQRHNGKVTESCLNDNSPWNFKQPIA